MAISKPRMIFSRLAAETKATGFSRYVVYFLLFSFIDFFSVTGAKHDNVIAFYVEYYPIITDAETVAADFRVGQPHSVLERIVFETKEGHADTLFNTSVKPVHVSDGF